jgi:hypothetical protein
MGLRRKLAAAALALAVGVAGAAIGCSLGLDPSLIDAAPPSSDASSLSEDVSIEEAAALPDASRADADAVAPETSSTVDAGGACITDQDCVAAAAGAGACVSSATCDPTWHVCLLGTCVTSACKASTCNRAQHTCSAPVPYNFEAARIPVGYGGVGGAPQASIAAAWPVLFVVTNNGVVAYNVTDPTSASPPRVTVHNLPFLPIAAVAVGRRVYFVGGTEGSGPVYHQAVAWVDVPQDPFLAELTAASAFVGTPTAGGVASVLTNGFDGLFVVYGARLAPTANLHPPIDDSTVLSPFANAGLSTGASIVASSGARLIAYRYDTTAYVPTFAIVNAAATSGAQATTEQPILSDGLLADQPALATGGDGSVLWSTGVYAVDGGGKPAGIAKARLTWVLGSGTAANFDPSAYVDLETYTPTTQALVAGPPVWVDANTALGLAAAGSASTDSTSVQVVTRSPPAIVPGTRTLLSVDPGSVGVTASGGFAYVLAEDDPNNQTCSVTIFAPGCGAADE